MSLKKYFIPSNYFYNLLKLLRAHNLIINHQVMPISFDELSVLKGVKLTYFNIDINDFEKWIKQYFPEFRMQFKHLLHKKLIEFYTTFTLLDSQPDDVIMDAAGGLYTYLDKIESRKIYLQDIMISKALKNNLGKKVEFIESDVCEINLPDNSIDKISCHHSFEHFQSDSDILFIKEIQRLLNMEGKCCILPIFIADRYIEVTNALTFNKKFDIKSKLVIDPTAIIPGGKESGRYSRIYNLNAFQERILNNIDYSNFKVTISELRMNGNAVPDLTLKCHKDIAEIERPYRAMVIERF